MSLQRTIERAIKLNGKPARVTWQATTDFSKKAPKANYTDTYAYEATVRVATQSGALSYEKRIYLPVLDRSIVGATIKIGNATWKVTASNSYEAGSRGALLQEATVV